MDAGKAEYLLPLECVGRPRPVQFHPDHPVAVPEGGAGLARHAGRGVAVAARVVIDEDAAAGGGAEDDAHGEVLWDARGRYVEAHPAGFAAGEGAVRLLPRRYGL